MHAGRGQSRSIAGCACTCSGRILHPVQTEEQMEALQSWTSLGTLEGVQAGRCSLRGSRAEAGPFTQRTSHLLLVSGNHLCAHASQIDNGHESRPPTQARDMVDPFNPQGGVAGVAGQVTTPVHPDESLVRKRLRPRQPSTTAVLGSLMGPRNGATPCTITTVKHQLNELLSWVSTQRQFLDSPLSSGQPGSALHELHHAMVCSIALCRSVGVHESILVPTASQKDGVRAYTARALASSLGISELRQSLVTQVLSDELASLVDLNVVTIQAHRLGLSPDAAHALLRAVCPSLVELRGAALGRSASRRAAASLREAIARAQCEIAVTMASSDRTQVIASAPVDLSPPYTSSAVLPPLPALTPAPSDVDTAQRAAKALHSLLLGHKLPAVCCPPSGSGGTAALDPSAPQATGRGKPCAARSPQIMKCPSLPDNRKAITKLQQTPVCAEAQLCVRIQGAGVRQVVISTCGGAVLPGLPTTSPEASSHEDESSSSDDSSDEDEEPGATTPECGADPHILELHRSMVRNNKLARLMSKVHTTERARDLCMQRRGAIACLFA